MTDGNDNTEEIPGTSPEPDAPAPAPRPWQPQPGPNWWAPTPATPPQPTWPPAPQDGSGTPTGFTPPPGYLPGGWGPAPTSVSHRARRLPTILVIVAVALFAFSAGMVTDRLAFAGNETSGSLHNFGLYNEALTLIRNDFVGRSTVTDKQLLYGSIKGLVNSLGDTGHTTFLTPQEYQQFRSQLSATFAGVGIVLAGQTAPYTIDRVLPGTPAANAGLKAGDEITAVDGVAASNLTYSNLVSKIRGAAGTSVKLTVIHPGSTTPVDVPLTRETLKVPIVAWGMVPGTHVADISLGEFAQGAGDQLQKAITQATTAGATSIVLDLRGNPGGFADEARTVASAFLSSGVVYLQRDSNGNKTPVGVLTGATHTNLRMVVLVDHDSASAAEIVAGALQDNHRAKIVGVTTFGTGTVLTPEKLTDGSVILLGTSDWLTPDGHRIFGIGITPDELVALTANAQPTDPAKLATMTSVQFLASTDAELLAAVKDLGQ